MPIGGLSRRAGIPPADRRAPPPCAGHSPTTAGILQDAPELLRQLPEPFRHKPDFRRQLPEHLRHAPEYRHQLPEDRRNLPELLRQLPELPRSLPEWFRHAPESFRHAKNLQKPLFSRKTPQLAALGNKAAFSHGVAAESMHYNFAPVHQTLRVTPAMEAGISNHVWNLEEIVALLDNKK
jgi:hypothetical protein